jgi:hypothetical protein
MVFLRDYWELSSQEVNQVKSIKNLAKQISDQKKPPKASKVSHTLSLDHKPFMLLSAYCKRRGVVLGDVVSDLIRLLLDELVTNGELTLEDQNDADAAEKAREDRLEKKDKSKRVG